MLSELFRIGSSKRVLKAQWQKSGIPFYRGREITKLSQDGFVDNELFITEGLYTEYAKKYGVPEAGDIVITAIGTIGNSYIVSEGDRFYFKDASVLWLKRTSDVCSAYINFWLKSPQMREQLDEGNGATVDTLTIKKLQSLVVDLPPIPEQKRIVAILDQAFADIDRAREITERNLHNIRELFESYLQQVFSQPGEGWSMVQLGSVCEIEKIKYKGNALPYVGMEDIEGRTGRFLGSLSPAEVASSTFQFTDEHLLYGRLRPYLNKVLTPDFTGHCSSEIFPLRPKSELDRKFLFYWLSSERVVQAIDKTCTGARMPRANVKEVLTFNIPLPPIPEQKRIVTILDQVFTDSDRARELNEKKLESLNELKKSLLQKAFSGELTGDQPGAAA